MYEESGLTILNPKLLGICYFSNFDMDDEWMYIYATHEFAMTLRECSEGELHWVLKNQMLS